jgi:hypothetical protein
MTYLGVRVLLALAAATLGLRTTAVLIPGINAIIRLIVSLIIGAALVVLTMRVCDSYGVHDLGLGLLISLSPVGVYDLAKWWIRR